MHTHDHDDILTRDFRTAAEGVSLTPEERLRMRRTLGAYAAMKPVRRAHARAASAHRWYVAFFNMRTAAAMLAVAVVASSAGVSYAAESALPGDTLYTVKVKINEPVVQALATTPQEKAHTAVKLAARRVDEAARLAAQGRLNATTSAALQVRFETHVATAVAAGEEADDVPGTTTPAGTDEAAASSTEEAAAATVTPTALADIDRFLSEEEQKLASLSEHTVQLAPITEVVKRERERVASKREERDMARAAQALARADEDRERPRIAVEDVRRRKGRNEEVRRPSADVAATSETEASVSSAATENTAGLAATGTATTIATTTATTTVILPDTEGFIEATLQADVFFGSYLNFGKRRHKSSDTPDASAGQVRGTTTVETDKDDDSEHDE